MTTAPSDALVFFGATGDLAYKKIFPALQAMARRGHLNVAVIGVAKAGWGVEQLRARARDSVEKHGGIDEAAFARLNSLLHYIDGDYNDPATFRALRKELGAAQRPVHYLAIPPMLFGRVVEQLGKSGCAEGARVVIEKPFGRDLASALTLNRTLLSNFDESTIFRIDHYLGKTPVPLDAENIVRGQFRGYRNEQGVSPTSQVETFAALRLQVNSWRWQGVPFYIRAGKNLPVTCTEVLVVLRRPPGVYSVTPPPPNYYRFRISPDVSIALGTMVMKTGDTLAGQPVELIASRHPDHTEMEAYERLLGDAMKGDATDFAREDYVEQAWRIVEPILGSATPVYEYEPNTWGPKEVDARIKPPDGWHNPAGSA